MNGDKPEAVLHTILAAIAGRTRCERSRVRDRGLKRDGAVKPFGFPTVAGESYMREYGSPLLSMLAPKKSR